MRRTIVRGREEVDGILFRLREDGQSVYKRIPFRNYFFILKNDYPLVEFLIREFVYDVEDKTDVFKNEFIKIILNDNTKRWKCQNVIENVGVHTYESDVNAVTRWITTNDTS